MAGRFGLIESLTGGLAAVDIDELFQSLAGYKLPFGVEQRLQDALEAVLIDLGITFEREVTLRKGDRIDFLVGSIGIECKVDGSMNTVASQLLRYAESDRISGLILVTTRNTHRFGVNELLSKPLRIMRITSL